MSAPHGAGTDDISLPWRMGDRLERLVRLTARALGAPVAYLSIVDGGAQRVRCSVGLPPTPGTLPLRVLLTEEVIARPGPLTAGLGEGAFPSAEGGPYVQSLLAVRLLDWPGDGIGVLGVLDQERLWGRAERELLEEFAGAIAAQATLEAEPEAWPAPGEPLDEAEERFRSLVENAADIIAVLSGGGMVEYITPSVEAALGFNAADLVGQNAFALLHPADALVVIRRFRQFVRGTLCDSAVHARVQRVDGSWRTFEFSVNNLLRDSAVRGIVVSARDVTEARDAQATERRLQAVLEATPDFVATFDPHGRALSVNAAFRRVAGIALDGDLSSWTLADLFPPAATQLILHEGIPEASRVGIWSGETFLKGPAGAEIPISQVIIAHRTTDGKAEYLSTFGRDITEQKGAENQVRKQAELLREAERMAHVGSWEWDLPTGKVTWSEELYRIYGLDPAGEPITYARYASLIHSDDRDRVLGIIAAAERDGRRFSFDHRIIRPDGTLRHLHGRGRVIVDSEGVVVRMMGSAQDITERKSAEDALRNSQEQLLQAQKMEAVGRLAGGVAHDFNNLLTAIKGFTELLLLEMAEDDEKQPYAVEIQAAANRAASLTRQLLAFSRKQVLQLRTLDLNVSIEDIDAMLRRLAGDDVALKTELGPSLGTVRADPTQIEQVLVNLIVNARDAMPTGGTILIRTANAELREEDIPSQSDAVPGEYVMLRVSDTGSGMPPEVLARAFEPFFTTKETGKGTGLGLATVYGIVQQSGGVVEVDSAPGEGTTFRIFLPRVDQEAESAVKMPGHGMAASGTETILLVEDEPAVRYLARAVLERHGYHIVEAESGPQAMSLVDALAEPIHLLLSDMVMPGMTGPELASRLTARLPHLRVLYMSGYTGDAVAEGGLLDTGVTLVEKPFEPEALLMCVREVLDGTSKPADG